MSLKIRLARAGAKVEEINKLLKMHRQMADVMKMMGGGKAKGIGAALGNMMGLGGRGGGMPQPTPEMMAEMQKSMGKGGAIPNLPGMPGLPGGKMPSLPAGLGGPGGLPRLPGLGGGFPFGGGKKK